MVTDLTLVLTEEALATVARHDPSLLAGLLDELHQTTETLIAELQVRILSRTSYREDGKQTPCLKSQ
jgi:hypothetical protein